MAIEILWVLYLLFHSSKRTKCATIHKPKCKCHWPFPRKLFCHECWFNISRLLQQTFWQKFDFILNLSSPNEREWLLERNLANQPPNGSLNSHEMNLKLKQCGSINESFAWESRALRITIMKLGWDLRFQFCCLLDLNFQRHSEKNLKPMTFQKKSATSCSYFQSSTVVVVCWKTKLTFESKEEKIWRRMRCYVSISFSCSKRCFSGPIIQLVSVVLSLKLKVRCRRCCIKPNENWTTEWRIYELINVKVSKPIDTFQRFQDCTFAYETTRLLFYFSCLSEFILKTQRNQVSSLRIQSA